MESKHTYTSLLEQLAIYQRNESFYTNQEKLKILDELEKGIYEVDLRYLKK